jgi:glucokinase
VGVTIGIDVGGTKIAGGVVGEDGNVIARRQISTEAAHPTAVVAGITKVALELRAAAPSATGIGVGAAGLVDFERGIVLSAPNIAWENVHLRAMLSDRVDLPVVVDNDANVAAWGEAIYGAGRGHGDQIMVTVGTGVGGGIIIGGAIYRGAHGLGAELGHIIVNEGGPQCACGNRGCLEAVASGNAIGRVARERSSEPGARAVIDIAGSPEAITGEIVGRAGGAGDDWAQSIIADVGRWLGVGLASFVNALDPDVIVIAGGAAAGTGDLLLDPARDRLAELIIGRPWRKPPPVLPAALGYDAGLVGAAALARA